MFLTATGLLLGCADGYALHLTPVVATPQEPFAGLDRIDLVLTPADGEALRVTLSGSLDSGASPEAIGLPELTGTRIAIEGYSGDVVTMRGMTEPLTTNGADVEASVLLADTEAAAWLGGIGTGLYMPMIAGLGEGKFWVAGGVTNSDRTHLATKGSDTVWTLSLAPPDDALAFVESGTLPTYEDDNGNAQTARVGATCTPLTVAGDDEGKLLITGGTRAHPLETTLATTSAMLYDPATDEWEDLGPSGALNSARSMHVAIENILGNVVVWGGYGSSSSLPNRVEFYDRATRSFTELANPNIGYVYALAADLGAEGTLLCGGADIDYDEWESSSTCARIPIDGSSVESFEDLPAGLAGAAMLTLADGRVLLTGGATTMSAASQPDDVSARSSAWLYNPSSGHWGSLSAQMAVARAGHTMTLLADGRVLIAGGAETFNLTQTSTDSLSCLEVFDPAEGSFEAINDCDESDDAGGLSGRADEVAAAYDPDFGVLLVGGLAPDGSAQSATALFVPEP